MFLLRKKHQPHRQRPQGGSRLRSTARQRGKQAQLAQALRRPRTLVDLETARRGKPRTRDHSRVWRAPCHGPSTIPQRQSAACSVRVRAMWGECRGRGGVCRGRTRPSLTPPTPFPPIHPTLTLPLHPAPCPEAPPPQLHPNNARRHYIPKNKSGPTFRQGPTFRGGQKRAAPAASQITSRCARGGQPACCCSPTRCRTSSRA